MRSRPITLEEFDRIFEKVDEIRPSDAEQWKRFLLGLCHSGLRVSELWALAWDADADVYFDLQHRPPLVRFLSEGNKRREDVYQPCTLEFCRIVCETPRDRRTGRVFPLVGLRNGRQITKDHAERIINCVGKASKVITDAKEKKHATTHDIGRRAFGTRLARDLNEHELAEWMRHKSIETTRAYYYAPKAEELASKVWNDLDAEFDTGFGTRAENDEENKEVESS